MSLFLNLLKTFNLALKMIGFLLQGSFKNQKNQLNFDSQAFLQMGILILDSYHLEEYRANDYYSHQLNLSDLIKDFKNSQMLFFSWKISSMDCFMYEFLFFKFLLTYSNQGIFQKPYRTLIQIFQSPKVLILPSGRTLFLFIDLKVLILFMTFSIIIFSIFME